MGADLATHIAFNGALDPGDVEGSGRVSAETVSGGSWGHTGPAEDLTRSLP
ncbi:hypothetical protein [Streptomyces sp. NPDC048643]|uniref:hypothetical protein n=1 Tax=Streptomyces sp. NPDC048643 TaxID=3155637 RepID=UPI00341ABBB1